MNEHPTDDLALYALGLVDERERDSIARHLETCATCREELRAHEATLAALAQSAERAAPRGLRGGVVARERRRSWLDLPRLALAGSFVAAIVLAAVAVVSVRQLDDVRAQRDEYARALEQVAEGARVVRLQTKTAGRAALVVPAGGPAMLLLDLPAPPEGKQYEAWVTSVVRAHPRLVALGAFLTAVALAIPVVSYVFVPIFVLSTLVDALT